MEVSDIVNSDTSLHRVQCWPLNYDLFLESDLNVICKLVNRTSNNTPNTYITTDTAV